MPIELFPLFADRAILPHSVDLPLRGRVSIPGTYQLELHRDDQLVHQETLHCDSELQTTLPAQAPGGPYTLQIRFADSTTDRLELQDILYGELYLLAGQSNMQLTVDRCQDPMPERFLSMDNPKIRELRLNSQPSYDTANGKWSGHPSWRPLSPETLLDFGALGLAFAEARIRDTHLPIGLINCSLGGTPIEAWLPHEDLQDAPELLAEFKHYQDIEIRTEANRAYLELITDWKQRSHSSGMTDPSDSSGLPWEPIPFPGLFFDSPYEDKQGVYWLRRRFHLSPAEWEQYEEQASLGQLRLDLGALVDADRSYLNGQVVGMTTYMYPPRRYPLAPGVLQAGDNELLIRLEVHNHTGGGVPGKFYGLHSPVLLKDLTATTADETGWELLPELLMEPLPSPPFWDRLAGTCYYAFIQPLAGFPLSGLLWYQGESNDKNPEDYELRFKRLIRRYQALFPGDWPFVYVQLAGYDDPMRQITPGAWDIVRDAQTAAQELPRTHMIEALDLGEWNDLHPQDKWTLGERMASALDTPDR